jgi:hypothetical protein
LITPNLLQAIVDFYDTANIEKMYNNDNFSSAYHSPVTADFEFLFARLLYHIGSIYKLGWSVALRRQVQKAIPDIRISKDNQTLWIMELKASMRWERSFICPIFYK